MLACVFVRMHMCGFQPPILSPFCNAQKVRPKLTELLIDTLPRSIAHKVSPPTMPSFACASLFSIESCFPAPSQSASYRCPHTVSASPLCACIGSCSCPSDKPDSAAAADSVPVAAPSALPHALSDPFLGKSGFFFRALSALLLER